LSEEVKEKEYFVTHKVLGADSLKNKSGGYQNM